LLFQKSENSNHQPNEYHKNQSYLWIGNQSVLKLFQTLGLIQDNPIQEMFV
jgi:hypothetical protein